MGSDEALEAGRKVLFPESASGGVYMRYLQESNGLHRFHTYELVIEMVLPCKTLT